jgi:hypothetical protein
MDRDAVLRALATSVEELTWALLEIDALDAGRRSVIAEAMEVLGDAFIHGDFNMLAAELRDEVAPKEDGAS